MADLNKLRQTKEYQRWRLNNQDQEAARQMAEIDKQEQMNPSKYTENDLEQAKCSIVEKIIKHFDDTIFEMVCEEMSKKIIFTSRHYLTEAGYDVFEDEWFEFYHEHHGDIMQQIKQNVSY
jgi:hypothetical protein